MIYLDNAASTMPYPEVAEYLYDYMQNSYANPSAIHKFGFECAKVIKYAEEQILRLAGLNDRNVIFTSGATESANLCIKGTAERFEDIKKIHLIMTPIEHPCVSEAVNYLNRKGAQMSIVGVDKYGIINEEELLNVINENTKLISLIWVNNETGITQDISGILKRIKSKYPNIMLHIDAVQGFGKIKADMSNADFITISAHKFHGPKGVGALICKKNTTIIPQILGGGHQNNLRSGTVNTPLIGAMGKACELADITAYQTHVINMRDNIIKRIKNELSGKALINTNPDESEYAPHIVNVSFPGLKGEVILHILEDKDIYISTASACSAHKKHSTVLSSMGISKEMIDGTVRISLSEFNTKEETDILVDELKSAVSTLSTLRRK